MEGVGPFRSWMGTVAEKGHLSWDVQEKKPAHKTPIGRDNNYYANFRTKQYHHLSYTVLTECKAMV